MGCSVPCPSRIEQLCVNHKFLLRHIDNVVLEAHSVVVVSFPPKLARQRADPISSDTDTDS